MSVSRTFISDGQSILAIDTVEYEGATWFVPAWLASPDEGWQSPIRIIRQRQYASTPNRSGARQGMIVPKAVLDGHASPQQLAEFEVRENPNIRIEIPKGIH
ncbi:MAG: hypothetical protein WAW96_12130 [Alphaproteobacteria bacterium]